MRLPKHRLRLEQLEDRRLLTITVDTLVDELDGSIVDGDVSLRDAIAAAPAGETIDFAVTGTILLDSVLGELVINKDLTIDGPGADQLTLDAQGNSRVMSIAENTIVEIIDMTITGGRALAGAGLMNLGTLTVSRSHVTGNTATSLGGGIYHYGSETLVVSDSVVSENSATYAGGGIYVDGVATITRSTISGNSVTYGGGGIQGGSLSIANSTISENIGFGLYLKGRDTLINSTVSGNSEAGILNDGGYCYIDHSTISGNSNGGVVTGLSFASGSTWINDSIVSGNRSTYVGEEIRVDSYSFTALNGFNLIGDSSKTIPQALYGVSVGTRDLLATSDGDTPTALSDILDTTLADNGGTTLTHALVLGSPAIDAGDPTAMAGVGDTPLYDQRGLPFTRVFDGDAIPGARIDIGAFELQPPLVSCDFDGDEICDGADIDALVGAIAAGTNDPLYDLTGDALVNLADRDAWLADAGAMNLASGNAYLLGDANLDGVVDGQDFIIWNANKFTFTGAWSQGDFDANGTTDGQDFVIWNMFKFQESDEEEALRSQGARTEGVLLFSS